MKLRIAIVLELAAAIAIACGPPSSTSPESRVAVVDVARTDAGAVRTVPRSDGGDGTHDESGDALADAVDTSGFTSRERAEWRAYVSELFAPCADVATTLAACVNEKRACKKCVPAAKVVARLVHEGKSREQIQKTYGTRYDANAAQSIPIDGSPVLGPQDARVTIVEFGDYECPACGKMAPQIEKLALAHPRDVRLVYKLLALKGHTHADAAARAAFAAGARGKFWDMHRILFANQHALDARDLERYARSLGLDLARFTADMRSPAAAARLATDDALGDRLHVTHTPTIFVDGREWWFDEGPLEERVLEQLD